MRILSRYFLASYLGLFVVVLFVTLLLMTVVEMLVNFDEIVEHREAAGGVVEYLVIRVPALYFRDVVPVASFIAAFLCLGLAARNREIMAIKAGGIRPARVTIPILVAASLLSIVALTANETILLGATREFTRFESPGQSLAFRGGTFWYHRGDRFYNVREADAESREMRGVTVYALDDHGRLRETVTAEQVLVEDDDRWLLRDARIRRFHPEDPTLSPEVEDVAEKRIVMAGNDLEMLDAGGQTLSVPQLLDVIAIRGNEDRPTERYTSMLHARLAEPATVLVFALLALPIGLTVERTRSLAISALFGIGLLAGFRASWHVATLLGRSGFAVSALAPWTVLTAFALLGAVLLLRSRR
ncbi:MAG: LptF/LptG family permease [Myxococcota bacterium]